MRKVGRSPRTLRVVLAAALAGVIVGCGSGSSTVPAQAKDVGVARSHPCGTSHARDAHYSHVVWIVFENHSFSQVIGSPKAPFINALGGRCGLATNFFAEKHPSLPNYIAMTSGGLQGVSGDHGPPPHGLRVPNLFSQVGSKWRALQQSMPSPCHKSDDGLYVVHHNPVPYYSDLLDRCSANDVPLGGRPDLSARFTFVTPNNCNNMHDCSVATGDGWLQSFMRKVFKTRQYRSGKTAVFITWDEGDGDDQRVPTLVVSPTTRPGTHSSTRYSHYSMLRTTEELLHLPLLGSAAAAPSMTRDFSL